MIQTLRVPDELVDPIFFPKEVKPLKKEAYQAWKNPFEVFSYELLFYRGEEAYLPWKKGEKHVPELYDKWRLIKRDCETLFSERKAGQALEPMKEGIGLFLSAVYWMHGKPVQLSAWEKHIEECTLKPVNLVERLSFIMERPALFHSFRQLCELFIEFEKLMVRNKLQKAKKGLSN
ncbi:YpoC family protein [Peribacillus sp. NPDC097675]|uniref:YpoC family protein n=1 Tax=Peribacillus sp. NPDC097675 TaxID=3390618 RepID=UPI003D08ADBC